MLPSIQQALNAHTYEVLAHRTVDGDTLHITADLGFFVSLDVDVRLSGLDAPEVEGYEAVEGKKVAAVVERWLTEHTLHNGPLVLKSLDLDKYRRSLGDVFDAQGNSLCDFLLGHQLAQVYSGGQKLPWTPQLLAIIDAFVYPEVQERRATDAKLDPTGL